MLQPELALMQIRRKRSHPERACYSNCLKGRGLMRKKQAKLHFHWVTHTLSWAPADFSRYDLGALYSCRPMHLFKSRGVAHLALLLIVESPLDSCEAQPYGVRDALEAPVGCALPLVPDALGGVPQIQAPLQLQRSGQIL